MTCEVNLICSLCTKPFFKKKAEVTFQNKKWLAAGKALPKPYFCSRMCGQHYSGITYAGNRELTSIARSLRKREASKYEAIKKFLVKNGIKHRFEWPIGDFIFDLVIIHESRKIVIEFDGDCHRSVRVRRKDKLKSTTILQRGCELHRIKHRNDDALLPSQVKKIIGI